MSEFQYYEFQAVDRHLSEAEMRELRRYSSRARITLTSFVNDYSFGSFKGDPNLWMEKYFDAFLYMANWGTNELQLRLPARLLPLETAQAYCAGEAASARETAGNVIVRFVSDEEGGSGWIEPEGILGSLLAIRDQLARGDYRALYLGWLLRAQEDELSPRDLEPPVPANLRDLSGPILSLAEFLMIDSDLLAAAAETSPSAEFTVPDRKALADWIGALPAREKDEILVQLLADGDPHVGRELALRFRREQGAGLSPARDSHRTVAQLLEAGRVRGEKRRHNEARQAATEKARREREEALAREKHLDALTGREAEVWASVEELIATKQSGNYDLAVRHLADLRDLAARQNREPDFAQAMAAFRESHSRKPSLRARFDQAGL